MGAPIQPPISKCCDEAGCKRARPIIFTRLEGRWLAITRWKDLGDGEIQVLERHDVTPQIDEILLQYRAWLDEQLMKAVTAAQEAQEPKLTVIERGRKS